MFNNLSAGFFILTYYFAIVETLPLLNNHLNALNKVNSIRRAHFVPLLLLNNELNNISQELAKSIAQKDLELLANNSFLECGGLVCGEILVIESISDNKQPLEICNLDTLIGIWGKENLFYKNELNFDHENKTIKFIRKLMRFIFLSIIFRKSSKHVNLKYFLS